MMLLGSVHWDCALTNSIYSTSFKQGTENEYSKEYPYSGCVGWHLGWTISDQKTVFVWPQASMQRTGRAV